MCNRVDLYKKLEKLRNGKLIVYITGDKRDFATQISQDAFDYFVNHLDKINRQNKIILFLYTRGGDTLAGWSIINLIRQFCEKLEIIIPSKAHSTGTLMALGANSIIMTKQATLGPIDPSVNGALNPIIKDIPPPYNRVPVSVEAIKGFIELAKDEVGIKDNVSLSNIFIKLATEVHPLVLGDVYRARAQIKMLAERLIKNQTDDYRKQKKIINFLTSEAGSHDYTINRREAKELGLNINIPNEEEYENIKSIYDDISLELQLNTPFDPSSILLSNNKAEYNIHRILIESVSGGKDVYFSEGTLIRLKMPMINNMPPFVNSNIMQEDIEQIQNIIKFEGWKHEEHK